MYLRSYVLRISAAVMMFIVRLRETQQSTSCDWTELKSLRTCAAGRVDVQT